MAGIGLLLGILAFGPSASAVAIVSFGPVYEGPYEEYVVGPYEEYVEPLLPGCIFLHIGGGPPYVSPNLDCLGIPPSSPDESPQNSESTADDDDAATGGP